MLPNEMLLFLHRHTKIVWKLDRKIPWKGYCVNNLSTSATTASKEDQIPVFRQTPSDLCRTTKHPEYRFYDTDMHGVWGRAYSSRIIHTPGPWLRKCLGPLALWRAAGGDDNGISENGNSASFPRWKTRLPIPLIRSRNDLLMLSLQKYFQSL